MMSFVPVWLLAAGLGTVGQLSFKAVAIHPSAAEGWARWRHMAQRPALWLGIGCFVLEIPAWTAFLSLVPLGRGVLLGSVNLVAIMLGGRLFFGETLTRVRWAGIGLVGLGIAIVGLGT
jgi:drug/metabolite transporter (DMT)-like permease